MRARDLLDGLELGGGAIDGAPERGVGEAAGEVADDEAEERGVARAGAQGAVDALADGAGGADAGVDGARVVVGAGVGLAAAAEPLGGAAEAVEVGVADDGVDRADARDDLGGDHLGAGAVLGLRGEDEARVAPVVLVHHVVVVVDPADQARPELLDERAA